MHKDKRRLGSGKIHHFTVGFFCDNLSRVTDFSGVSLLHSCDVRTVRGSWNRERSPRVESREGLVRVRVRVRIGLLWALGFSGTDHLPFSFLFPCSRLREKREKEIPRRLALMSPPTMHADRRKRSTGCSLFCLRWRPWLTKERLVDFFI